MNQLISIIIPVYNEEDGLLSFHEQLNNVISSIEKYKWEILYINDGSSDNTLSIIDQLYKNDQRVSYINLSRNFGKESAMLAGFDYMKGDAAIIMDADLQDPPALIPELLDYWEEGYEDIYAKRRTRGKESWLRHKLSILFYNLLDKSTNFEILKNVGDFRLLDYKCIEALRQLRESERYTKGLFCWIGFKKKEILFDRGDRQNGKSHWNFMSLANLAIEGITSFTTMPLRLATLIGIITGIGAMVYLVWTLIKVLLWGDPVAGFPTLICVILFLGSVQLICMGILGEYIARIFNESKHRPNYVISNYCKSE